MKILNFDIFRYALPLSPPVHIKHHNIKKRLGYVLRIEDENGNFAYGEVAPLPGINKEDMLSSLNQMKKLRRELIERKIPPNLSRLEGEFERWLSAFGLYPSVRFGMEMAILNLEAIAFKDSLFPLYYRTGKGYLKLNGLVMSGPSGRGGGRQEIWDQVKQLLQDGYSSIKIKVGSKNVQEDIEMVNYLIELAGDDIDIRLDANRSWTLEQSVEFGKNIPSERIEYIEEPLRNSEKLVTFYHKTGVPIALDESLVEMSNGFKPFEGLTTIVIKPGVIGGFEKAKTWINRALKYELSPILSCPFLSGVGLAAIANFACNLKLNHLAMGLDTFKWFRKDLPEQALRVKNGEIRVDREYEKSRHIRMELLEKVS